MRFLTKKNLSGGFTLFEMIVVTAIIAFITASILAEYPELGSRFSLSRIAREISLSMRQAQTYGLAVREFPVENNIYPPYGFYIKPVQGSDNSFIIFGDFCDNLGNCSSDTRYAGNGDNFFNPSVTGFIGPNGNVDCGGPCERLEELRITREVVGYDVCVVDAGRSCWSDGSLEELHITFRRPDPQAHIRKIPDDNQDHNSAEIIISSSKVPDAKKVVRIWITGQISVQDYVEP